MVARWAHAPKAVGSNPTSNKRKKQIYSYINFASLNSVILLFLALFFHYFNS